MNNQIPAAKPLRYNDIGSGIHGIQGLQNAACSVKQQGDIENSMAELVHWREELLAAVTKLQEKIVPLCKPPSPCNSAENQKDSEPSLSPLGYNILKEAKALKHICFLILGMEKNIEI